MKYLEDPFEVKKDTKVSTERAKTVRAKTVQYTKTLQDTKTVHIILMYSVYSPNINRTVHKKRNQKKY